MTASELKKIIKEASHSSEWRYVASSLCGSYRDYYKNYELIQELASKGYDVNSVTGYGGEGEGDQYWGVFSVTYNGEVSYFKLDGYYSSYSGADIYDPFAFYTVKEVPVTKTEWVKE